MKDKLSDVEKIRIALELRARGLSVDIENAVEKEDIEEEMYFKGGREAILEMHRKMSDMKYIDAYIQSKGKYMTDEEKEKWIGGV